MTQTVTTVGTTTTAVVAPATIGFGNQATMSVTVAPVAPATGTPTGTVQFSIDAAPFGAPVA